MFFLGGISKYQDAFFTEEFRQSVEGKSQQANVQRLKQLMLKQVQILETALALHGNLAPEGVQPLHKRLLERFTQMKQSINGMDKIKRHFSESIVHQPLPPLPIEKRSMSVSNQRSTNNHDLSDEVIDDHSNYHMMNFEKEEIYTRPSKFNGNHEIKPLSIQRCISSRDQSSLIRGDSSSAPPVPIRPKSAGYGNYDSPEIPPKSTTQNHAPPLPPRRVTPDKRISNPLLSSLNYCSIDYQENDLHSASMIKSPLQKYSVVNIPLEDQAEADHDHFNLANISCSEQIEFRDSGISTASHDLNYAFICSDATRTIGNASSQHVNIAMWQTDMNANDNEDEARNPPPIPRKMTNSMNYGMNHSNSDLFKEDSLDHSSIGNGDEPKIDDYCKPKISNANNH